MGARGYGNPTDDGHGSPKLSRTNFDVSPMNDKELTTIYRGLPGNVVNIARDAGTERAFSQDNYYVTYNCISYILAQNKETKKNKQTNNQNKTKQDWKLQEMICHCVFFVENKN